jgi:iron complex outermembrane receptor protein
MPRIASLASCALFTLVPAVAHSRAPADGRADGPSLHRAPIEEIIITATRRATPLHDAPLSVSALNGDTLSALGDRDIIDWFERVPGLTYSDDAFTGHRLTMRGIATSGLEPRPSVGHYLDDAPLMNFAGSAALGTYGGPRPQVVDIDRIEVLRGPQGSLFGSGTLGGAIRTITNAPDLSRTSIAGEVMYSGTAHGGDNHFLSGVLNTPLSDTFGVRFVGYERRDAGYIDNDARGIDDINELHVWGGRVGLRWEPTDDLALMLKVHHQDRSTDGMNATDADAGDYSQRKYAPEHDKERWNLASFTVQYDLAGARLESTTSHLERKPRHAWDVTEFSEIVYQFKGLDLFHPVANNFNAKLEDTVQEIRLTSSGDHRLDWLLGVFYQHQRHDLVSEWVSPGFDTVTGGLAAAFGYPDRPGHEGSDSALDQYAGYGELTYAIDERWELTLGNRWYSYDLEHDQFTDGFLAGEYSAWTRHSSETGSTPKASLSFRPTENSMYYANVATGARPGGPNQFSDAIVQQCEAELEAAGFFGMVPDFESDDLTSYEVGMKSSLLDGRLSINAAAYHIDWQDTQVFLILGCGYGLAANAGDANVDGAELELVWAMTHGIQSSMAIATVDSRLADDAPSVSGESGEALPGVPDWTVAATVDQEFTLGLVDPFWSVSYRYVASSWSELNEAVRARLPSRSVFDVRFGVRRQQWVAELFVDNLTDERSVLNHSNNLVGEWDVIDRPRTVGIRVRYTD